MTAWTGARVAEILETAPVTDAAFSSIATDTRTLNAGALFVALKGERFDAHAFLADARARGAVAAVVARGTAAVDGLPLFRVDDPLHALGLLARARRRDVAGPVIAVTGTNGKTATKEMLAAVVDARWAVHATRANLNNLVGVPLTMLGAAEPVEALVVEAGANAVGEIARLRDIIEPSVAVITNVSAGHTEGFGSVEGVMREKLELVRGARVAVVGGEPPELGARAREVTARVLVAGTAEHADVRPDQWRVRPDGRVELTLRGETIALPLVGAHHVENATIALAVARELSVEAAKAAAALRGVRLPAGRCEVMERGPLMILNDAYNANPASIAALLDTVRAMRGGRRLVIVLGTMLELGPDGGRLHDETADRVLAVRPDVVAAVGAFVPAFERHRATLGAQLLTGPDPDTLGAQLAGRLTGRELVVLKASRGVRLERVIPHLLPGNGGECSTTS